LLGLVKLLICLFKIEPFIAVNYQLKGNRKLICGYFLSHIVEEDCRMKRQKRDRLERAHAQGYRAGVTGRSKEICPYQGLDTRSQWLGGWREAIEDRNVGLFNKGQ
jgi:ribosome modulation factor